MKEKSMKLNELLSVAGQGYPDTWAYLDAASGNDYCDDTLALFVVRELRDTFAPSAPAEAQLNEAIRAMRVARDDLDGVVETLLDKLCEVQDGNTRNG